MDKFSLFPNSKKTQRRNLKSSIKNRILGDIIAKINSTNPALSSSIMILDKSTSEIIEQFISVPDLSQAGVLFVENLELKRKPFRNMNGIYVIRPTLENFQRIDKDFGSEWYKTITRIYDTYKESVLILYRIQLIWESAYLHHSSDKQRYVQENIFVSDGLPHQVPHRAQRGFLPS